MKSSHRRIQRIGIAASMMGAFLFACGSPVHAQQLTATSAVSQNAGENAVQEAARSGKYLFVFFYKQDDQQTQSMQRMFQDATGKMSAQADAIAIPVTDPKNGAIVKKYGVSRAPMPLVLAIAPNGAVTKALPVNFSEQQLRESVVSTGTATCLKALQDRKLVLLCVKLADEPKAFQGVRDLSLDPRFAESSQIVNVNAADPSEASFLPSWKVDTKANKAVTVVLTPPGQPVATFQENATKAEIVQQLTKLSSSSCCPGGTCAAGQKCGPAK